MTTTISDHLEATTDDTVAMEAGDPVSRAGIEAALTTNGLRVVADHADAATVVVVAESVDDSVRRTVRKARRSGVRGVVLVVAQVDDDGLYAAVEAGACSLLRRSEATPERLAEAVRDVGRGRAHLPGDLLARLLAQVSKLYDQVLEPRGLRLDGLDERERTILRLVAEGLTTCEIAAQLSYSERTIKKILQNITTRLGVRNRAHAVSHAMRHGWL